MKLSFHILRAHVGPFLFAFVTLIFVFLMQFLMRAVDQLVGKGLSWLVIGELISLSLASMVVLAVPMSVLVATLMAFGKLSSQNEITAMKASGMSLYRMMIPVILISILLTYSMLEFNNKVLPEANHRWKVLMTDIRRTKPTLTIEQGLFSQDIQGYSILARKTEEKSNDLTGVIIYDYTDPSMNVVVTAEKGKVSFTPDYRKLIMDLYDGEIHQMSTQDKSTYRRMRFERHRIVMNVEGFDFERSGENALDRGDRELSVQDMEKMVDGWRNANDEARRQALQSALPTGGALENPMASPIAPPAGLSIRQYAINLALTKAQHTIANIDNQQMMIDYNKHQINQYLVEIHKKYAIPVACLVFVFIGAPLGIIARRGTFGVAATFSLGFFLLYWASLIGGEKLADRAIMPPWLGMWMANIVLSALGIYLTLRMGRETPAINWARLRRFVPKALRAPEAGETSAEEHERI